MSYLNKNFKFILISIVLIICFYRSPFIFLNGRFLAEDGSFWFSNAYTYGYVKGITQMYLGTQYFNLWANFSSVVASLFPINYSPLVIVYMAFIVQLYLYIYIIFGHCTFLKTKLDKIIGVFIVIVTPPMVPAVWLASNLSQVYLAILTFLIFFQEENKKYLFNKFSPFVLFISSLSSILPCIFSPFFIYKYIINKTKLNFYNAISILIGTIFQSIIFFSIKVMGLESLSDGPRYIISSEKILNYFYNVMVKSFFGRDITQFIYNKTTFHQDSLILLMSLFFFIFLFAIFIIAYKKKDKVLSLLIFFFIIQSFLAIYAAKFEQVQGRYAVIPSILLIFSIYRTYQVSAGLLKYITMILILFTLMTGLYEFKNNNIYSELLICKGCPDWKYEVAKWKKDQNYKLKIWQYPQKTMTLGKKK